jgi:hypothetical protein
MAYKLTKAFKDALARSSKDPQFILKIDGIDEIFGAVSVDIVPKYDMPGLYYNQPGLYYDKVFKSPNSRDWINLGNSTSSIQQQIEPDKAGGTSTNAMTFEVVDLGQRMSEIVSPGFVLEEILGRKAKVSFMLKGDTAYPVDAITVIDGTIDEVVALPGAIRITVSHPQNLLRQDFLPPFSSNSTGYFHYKSVVIQDILFLARNVDSPTIQVKYQYAGTPQVVVSLYDITIDIVNGVTTADDVVSLIEGSASAFQLVQMEVVGSGTTVQVSTGGFVALGNSSTIQVEDVSGLVMENSDPMFKTYVNIDDEILKVTSINTSTNTITVDISQRSLFKSKAPEIVEPETEVKSFYVIEGGCLDVALKMILSLNESQIIEAQFYGKVPGIGLVTNSVFFPSTTIQNEFSFVEGDIVSLDGIFTNRTIVSFESNGVDSWIIVSGANIGDGDGPLDATFSSKYNTLPIGCGIDSIHVDVERFEDLKATFPTTLPTYRFYITDSINMKEFLESQIFFPSGAYLCPRKGRISCAIARPAIGSPDTVTLDSSNVLEPETRYIVRGLNQNFYNSINWYFDEDSIESEDYLKKIITVDADSISRFKVGNRPLIIESKGLRTDLTAETFINNVTRRLLDRYKFVAEMVEVKVNLQVGIPVEIADTVIYGNSDVQLTDITQGSRDFQPRVWEVINKQQTPTDVTLTLLETKYSIDGRFGMISPNSYVGSGSTLGEIVIDKSFGTEIDEYETDKWIDYVGNNLLIRSLDWSVQYSCQLDGVSNVSGEKLIVSGLGSIPTAGMIVDLPTYEDSTANQGKLLKALFCFYDPQVAVVSGVSNFSFNVSLSDAAKFVVGLPVRVHNDSYSIDSGESTIKVTSVVGTLITVNKTLGFTPSAGQKVDLIGFIDSGKPYVIL